MSLLQRISQVLLDNERLFIIVGAVMLVLVVLGYVVFYQFVINPQVQLREQLITQLYQARADVMRASQQEDNSAEVAQMDMARLIAERDAAADIFLSEPEAAVVLDKLYQYDAAEAGVEVVNVESLPDPEQLPETYDFRRLSVEVYGVFSALMHFVTQIEEATIPSVSISSVNIPEIQEGLHQLTMEVTIYISKYAPEKPPEPEPLPTASGAQRILSQLDVSLEDAWTSEDWPRAIAIANQIIKIDPGYTSAIERLYMAYVNYGYELLGQGDQQGAASQFQWALEVNPAGQEAMVGLNQITVPGAPTAAPGATPVSGATVAPVATQPAPSGQATAHPYLVRPSGWPTDQPWPPSAR